MGIQWNQTPLGQFEVSYGYQGLIDPKGGEGM